MYIYVRLSVHGYIGILNPIFWWAFVIRGYPGLLEILRLLRPWHVGTGPRRSSSTGSSAVKGVRSYGGFLSHKGTPSHHAFLDGMFRYKPPSYGGVLPFLETPYIRLTLQTSFSDVPLFLATFPLWWPGTTGSVIEVDLTGELWPACPDTSETRRLLIPAVSDYGAMLLGRTPPSNSRIFSLNRCKLSAVSWSIRRGQQVGCHCLSGCVPKKR